MRKATRADVPHLVAMARDFHNAHEARCAFSQSDMAEFFERLFEYGVIFITEGGFIAGAAAGAVSNASHLTAHEILWWATDGQGQALRKRFEQWAENQGCADVEFSHPEQQERVSAVMQRAGYSPATRVWRKAI